MSDAGQITAADIKAMLATKYSPPTWAFLTEVPNATSWNKTRTIDGIACGCWKSAGIEIHGFEIKVGRGDWLKEIDDLSKSATFQKHCHRFWIVATKDVVKLEELPAEWGLMVANGNGLKVKSAASLRNPEPMQVDMISAMMRRALAVEKQDRENDERYNDGFKAGLASAEQKLKFAQQDKENCLKRIEEFEKATGLTVNKYLGPRIGEHLELLARVKHSGRRGETDIRSSVQILERLSRSVQDILADCNKLKSEWAEFSDRHDAIMGQMKENQ